MATPQAEEETKTSSEEETEMSEAIVIADLHAHRTGIDSNRLDDLLKALKFVFEYAKLHSIKDIFYLGDICHNRNKVDFLLIWHLLRELYWPEQLGIRQTFLPGNHDWVLGSEGVHTLELFRGIGDVIDQPRLMIVDRRIILLVPFCRDRESFKKQLGKVWEQFEKKEIKGNRKPLLFVHQGFDGFKVGSDFVLEQDLLYKDLKPDKFDLIVSGHYHKHQSKKKLVYCGSPYQLNFGERDNTTGFVVVGLDDPVKWKFVPIPATPKFVRVERASHVHPYSIEGNFVQVSDESLLEKVKKLKPRKLIFVPEKRKPKLEKRLEVTHSDSLDKVLAAYVKKEAGEIERRATLLSLGLEILEEARSGN